MNRKLRRQMSRNPELIEVLKRHPEWTPTLDGSGHWQLRHPSGATVPAAASPSSRRSIHHTEAAMRRIERGAAS